MDEAYDYKIGSNEFDPGTIFPEIITPSDNLSAILQKKLTPTQDTEFEDHILKCLATMVYGSDMIERARGSPQVKVKFCLAIFRGEDVPEDIGETEN